MDGLEVSLVMAQAALGVKNSSIGEAAAAFPLIDGDNSVTVQCWMPIQAHNQTAKRVNGLE